MNRFSFLLILIVAMALGACNFNVNVDPAEGDVEINGTVPAETDAGVTLTETLAITDTTAVTDTEITDTEITDTETVTETGAVTETDGITATDVLDPTPTPLIEPTATVTDGVTSAGAAVTTTQQMTDSEEMTGTQQMTGTGTTTDTTVTSGMTMVPDTSDMTIAEVVQSLDAFSTLEQAVETAGVGEALTVDGPITVFAPVDAAFDAIPEDQLQALLDDPALLAEILQYHIVIDAADSAELARLNAAQSTSGQPLAINVGLDGEVLVNDAQLVYPDIQTANGIIHVINQVLIPPTVDLEVPAADPASIAIMPQPADDTLEELSAADTSDQTVVEVVNAISGLSTAATAIDAAGLTDVLEQPGPFTLFVPTDPAFAELPAEQLTNLLNDSAALADVLQYHLVLDTVTSGDLAVLPTLLTASGETLTVNVQENGRIFINGAPVYQADIEASNGIIHVVGEVITPLPESP